MHVFAQDLISGRTHGAIKAALGEGAASFTSGGDESAAGAIPANPVRANELKPSYPAGKPLSPNELRALRPHAPVGKVFGYDGAAQLGPGGIIVENAPTIIR